MLAVVFECRRFHFHGKSFVIETDHRPRRRSVNKTTMSPINVDWDRRIWSPPPLTVMERKYNWQMDCYGYQTKMIATQNTVYTIQLKPAELRGIIQKWSWDIYYLARQVYTGTTQVILIVYEWSVREGFIGVNEVVYWLQKHEEGYSE